MKKGVLRGLWPQRQHEAVVCMPSENKAQYTIIMMLTTPAMPIAMYSAREGYTAGTMP